jgi:hypothetical protein
MAMLSYVHQLFSAKHCQAYIHTLRDVDMRGLSVHLDGGCDSPRNRQMIFNAGMIPNITEHPRHHTATKRGRKRLFNAAIHA